MSRSVDRIRKAFRGGAGRGAGRDACRWALVGLLWATLCPAFSAGAAEGDDVRQAALTFLKALENGNVDELRSIIWAGSSSQRAGREEVIALIAAHKRLERSAAGRWAEQGKRLSAGFEMFTGELDRNALQAARLMLGEGDKARLYCPGETGYLRLLRSGDRWQVSLPLIENEMNDESAVMNDRPDGFVRMRIDRFRLLALGVADVAARVEAGEFAAPTDAETALAAKLAEVATEMNRRRTAMWQRRINR